MLENSEKFGEEGFYCGSAMTAVFYGEETLVVANSGDCNAFMGLINKKTISLTQTHRVEGHGKAYFRKYDLSHQYTSTFNQGE